MILAADGATGLAAIVTAIGGVGVSLATVYLNSRKQASATSENTGNISGLTDQIADMAQQLSKLREENTRLTIEVQVLRAQVIPVKPPAPEPEEEEEEVPVPKKPRKPAAKKAAPKKKK